MRIRHQPGTHTHRVEVPAAWATADTESDFPAFRAPFDIKVVGARFIADAAITANATNHAVLAVNNGATVIASHAFDTVTTDDLAALGVRDLTLSATAADLLVDEGTVLDIEKTTPGTGVAVSGVLEIDYQSRG